MSNYFYREMSPLLRWLSLPFLLLSGVTLFVLVGAALEHFNIKETNYFLDNRIFNALGIVGSLFQMILTINAAVLLMLIALAIPLGFILRDLHKTLKRFGIELDPRQLSGEESYLNAAQKVFDNDSKYALFIYGHTHQPSLTRLGERVVINTGTWLKRLDHVPALLSYLPGIFVPSYCLNYFKISEADGQIVIDYGVYEKDHGQELDMLQRLLAARATVDDREPIPRRTVLDCSKA